MFFHTQGKRERKREKHLKCKDAVQKTDIAGLWENIFWVS